MAILRGSDNEKIFSEVSEIVKKNRRLRTLQMNFWKTVAYKISGPQILEFEIGDFMTHIVTV